MKTYKGALNLLLGKRDIAIWGTGGSARAFIAKNKIVLESVSLFIDNDITKQGSVFYDKTVFHPSKIHISNSFFIIVTGMYYSEIREQLINCGLKEYEDFVSTSNIKEVLSKKLSQISQEDYERLSNQIKDYNDKNLKHIEKLIEQKSIQVISFDIFDTLLIRPVEKPTDLFDVIGRQLGFQGDFKEKRIMAEKTARLNKMKGHDDITIEDIYKEFSKLYHYSQDEVQCYMRKEMEVEFNSLRKKESVYKIYQCALELGKEVIITSDMYLSYGFLTDVLRHNGYCDFETLYVSSEEKLSKGSGRLYEKIVDIYHKKGINPDEMIHIGDNYHADIVMAEKHGLKAGYIPKHFSDLIDLIN